MFLILRVVRKISSGFDIYERFIKLIYILKFKKIGMGEKFLWKII